MHQKKNGLQLIDIYRVSNSQTSSLTHPSQKTKLRTHGMSARSKRTISPTDKPLESRLLARIY